jgi:branched-chain amino acid aminotransferase
MGPPNSALFYVLASPMAALFTTGQKDVSLEATTKYARAWPGGMGAMKVGGNYAPCFVPQVEAASRGFQQNLWLSEPRQACYTAPNYYGVARSPD